MKSAKIIIAILGLALLMFAIGCSPSDVDSGNTGTYTPSTTTSSPAAMLVTATTNSLSSGNGTAVTAYVVDNIGQPVVNATVRFSMDSALKGQLSASSTVTDMFGNATITFMAGQTTTTARITGTIGSISSYTDITIGGGGQTINGNITVGASPSNIVTTQTSTITATLTDLQGAPAPAGIQVTFSLSSNAGTLSSFTAQTLSNGVATVVLTGNIVSQQTSVTVTASATNYNSGTTIVSVSPNNIDSISMTASSTAIRTYSTTTITVGVSGPNFIATNNYTINLSLNSTIASLPATFVTTTNNTAQIVLTSLSSTGDVILTATSTSPSAQSQITINISAPPPDNLTVLANPNPIPVNATTTISALVTANSNSVADGTLVNFVVEDSTLGTLAAATGSTVAGVATTTFTASNKAGTARITATAGGGVARNSVNVTIQPATVGSIQFVSASPQLIGIKTSTSTPSSVIKFLVNDVSGRPVMGAAVNFVLNGPGGNEYIGSSTDGSPTADTQSTAADGTATVILHSGTVAGPVTITASTSVDLTTTISTSATQVSIGGGIPSESHWNLATSSFNLAGLKYSGLQTTISAYIGDRFGNYNIPNSTTISFYTEGGAIGTQGITDASGFTSVTLRTQAPNPADVAKGTIVSTEPWRFVSAQTATYNPRDGWVTVLATAQGEEAFLDENGDGLFSTGTPSTSACPLGYTCECSGGPSVTNGGTCIGSRSEPFSDLSEPFYDKNDDGCRNDGAYKYCTGAPAAASTDPYEQFINTNPGTGVGQNYSFDLPNGKWDGPDCATTGCQKSKMIWKDITVVFTNDYYFWPMPDGTCYSTTSESGGRCNATYDAGSFAIAPASITKGSAGSFLAIIGDPFLNSLPGGTPITATASEGTVTPASVTLVDHLSTGPTWFSFVVDVPADSTKSVTTVSVSIDGEPPAIVTVPLTTPPPAAPSLNTPTIGGVGTGIINLSWGAVTGATTYTVFYDTGTPVTTGAASVSGITATNYTFTGTPTTTYYFTVRASNGGGSSGLSNEVSAVAP